MQSDYLLTPYFLDRLELGLQKAAGPGWRLNQVALPEGSQQQRMLALYEPLAHWVAETAAAGRRPVSVAGDCCTTVAVLAGLQRAGLNPTLIWLDAHGDFNTWETTPSGFLGGMPLAMLVGRGEQTLVEGVGLQPLPESQVLLSDARDLDPGEREAVAASAIVHLPQLEQLLEYPLPPGPLYVHFDTDVVDPADLPAMNYPAPGGPSAALVRRLFRRLAGGGQLAAVSLSAWAPALDKQGDSRRAAISLLTELTA